jgi:hypothetical protein
VSPPHENNFGSHDQLLLYDMTSYYWDALEFQLKADIASFITFHFQASRESLHIAALDIRNYMRSVPAHFWVDVKHHLFLHKQGFLYNKKLAGIPMYIYIYKYMHVSIFRMLYET